jgi:Mrp family chromosome partitioning ATPase
LPLPPGGFSATAMSEIVERLSSVADLVIVDSTPVLSLSDALELAPAMDGVLLVVDVGKASWGEVEESALQLRSVGAQMLGVVAAKVVPGRFRGYHHARYEEYQRLVPAPTPSGPVDSDDGESQREHAGRGDDGDSAGMAAGSR